MSQPNDRAHRPWQPLTFGGVADFAHASLGRLLAMELVVAALAAVVVVRFLAVAWCPSIRQAIQQLPAPSGIRDGRLQWPGSQPMRLVEGEFLSIVIDPANRSDLGLTADLQWEFRKDELRVRSLLGYVAIPYPAGWIIAFNRSELEPWWGAWEPAVLAGAGALVIFGLLMIWAALAAVYLWVSLVIGWFADRQVTRASAWKLASAALMPGALIMSAAILLYSLVRLPLAGLLFIGLLHGVIPWIYLFLAPLRLPRLRQSVSLSQNPFQLAEPESESKPDGNSTDSGA